MIRLLIYKIIICILLNFSALAWSEFIDNNNGTITDKATGLIWQKNSPDKKMKWKQALEYCEHLSLNGHSDWRLPNVEELRSIADYSKFDPTIDTKYFSAISYRFWSSTTYAPDTGDAWCVNFYNGDDDNDSKSSAYYVRAVRPGQSRSFDNLVIGSSQKSSLPPGLSIENISFSEKVLDAMENAEILIYLKNFGPGDAHDVHALISTNTSGISIPDELKFPDINVNAVETLTIPVNASMELPDSYAEIIIQIIEPHFKVKINGKRLRFKTRGFIKPDLKLSKFDVKEYELPTNNQRIDINEMVYAILVVQNLGRGEARDIEVTINNRQKGLTFLGLYKGKNEIIKKPAFIKSIAPGKYKIIKFCYFINSELTEDEIRFDIAATEKYQKFGFKTTKMRKVNTVLKPEGHIKQIDYDDSIEEPDVIIDDVPDLIADIDNKIPASNMKNPDSIAVIIGNKDYEKTDNVKYAINDALSMKRYIIDVLGYDQTNVFLIKNAKKGDFDTYFGTIENHRGILSTHVKPNKKSDVFIYYSGHGAVGANTKKGFLVPVEADPQRVELGGYSTETFYKNLSYINARSFTIILDSCFSGAKRVSPMKILWSHDKIKLKNGVLMTSSRGTQYSSWYEEKQHGLFTYFFLKGIQSKKADFNHDHEITLKELFQYVSDRSNGVPYYSLRLNNIEQNPTISGQDYNRVLVSY